MCAAKTRKDLYSLLEQAIKEAHTYDVPEILATSVVEGNKSYTDWISQETKGSSTTSCHSVHIV